MFSFVATIRLFSAEKTGKGIKSQLFIYERKKNILQAFQPNRSFFCIEEKNLKKKFQKRSLASRTLGFEIITLLLSSMGILETFYLFLSKLNETSIFCVNQTCSIVLNSAFSDLFGVPLVFLGLISYSLIGFFSLYHITLSQNIGKNSPVTRNTLLLFLILFGSFDIYFIFILENLLETACYWCILSIFYSGSIVLSNSLSRAGFSSPNLNFLFFVTSFLAFLIFLNYTGNIVEMVGFLE